jgi:hypothetical protein
MKNFIPYFEANGVRYTTINGMRVFLSQRNRAIAVQSASKIGAKVSQDPLLVRFWQNEMDRKYSA